MCARFMSSTVRSAAIAANEGSGLGKCGAVPTLTTRPMIVARSASCAARAWNEARDTQRPATRMRAAEKLGTLQTASGREPPRNR
jgi:hypothetical protein